MVAKFPSPLELGSLRIEPGRAIGGYDTAPLSRVASATADALGTLGKGIAKAGEGAMDLELDKGRYEYTEASAQALTRRIDLDQRYDTDTDYTTRRERYGSELNGIVDEVAESISSPQMRARFVSDQRPQIARASATQDDKGRAQYHQAEKGYLATQADRFIEQAGSADEETRTRIIDSYRGMVDARVGQGIISPVEGRAQLQAFGERFFRAGHLAAVNSGDRDRMETWTNGLRAEPDSREERVGRILQIEGDGRDRRSTAVGGFRNATWLELIRRHRPELADGKSDQDVLEMRADRALRSELAGKLYDENVAGLTRRGVEPTAGNTYLAHFFGPGVAAAVIKAPPGTAVVDIIAAVPGIGVQKAREIVEANPEVLQGKQTGSIVEWAERRMGGVGPGGFFRVLPADTREQLLAQGMTALQARQTNDTAGFNARVSDSVAEAASTGAASRPVSRTEFIAQHGAEDGGRRHAAYAREIQFGADLQTVASLSPEQAATLATRYAPAQGSPGYADQAERHGRLVQAIERSNRERTQDPAGFAIQRLPAARAAFTDFNAIQRDPLAVPAQRASAAAHFARVTMLEQERVGVPADQRRIVPKAYAEELKTRIQRPATAGGSGNVATAIEAEAQLWGKHWDLVYRDLAPQLQPVALVIGSGVTRYAGQVLAENATVSIKDIANDQSDVREAEIKKAVREKFSPFRQSLAGNSDEQQIFNAFQAMGEKLAAHYVRANKTADAAAEAAFEDLLGHKYRFVHNTTGRALFSESASWFSSGPRYRVPVSAGISDDTVIAGADAARARLPEFKLAAPDDDIGGVTNANRAAARVANYMRDGVWVTAPGDVGLMLTWRDRAVKNADGGRLIITWEGLDALAKAPRSPLRGMPGVYSPALNALGVDFQ